MEHNDNKKIAHAIAATLVSFASSSAGTDYNKIYQYVLDVLRDFDDCENVENEEIEE